MSPCIYSKSKFKVKISVIFQPKCMSNDLDQEVEVLKKWVHISFGPPILPDSRN